MVELISCKQKWKERTKFSRSGLCFRENRVWKFVEHTHTRITFGRTRSAWLSISGFSRKRNLKGKNFILRSRLVFTFRITCCYNNKSYSVRSWPSERILFKLNFIENKASSERVLFLLFVFVFAYRIHPSWNTIQYRRQISEKVINLKVCEL